MWVRTLPIVQLIGLLVASIVVGYGALAAWEVTHPVALAPAQLAGAVGRQASARCTAAVIDPYIALANDDDEQQDHVFLCPFGDRALVVLSDQGLISRDVTGLLMPSSGAADELWARSLREHATDFPPTYGEWLDARDADLDRVVPWVIAVLGAGTLIGWGFFVRRAVRRRRLW